MAGFINIVGRKFGMLTVIRRLENRKTIVMWLCKCECGNTTEVSSQSLRTGHTKSCGCYRRSGMFFTTHRLSRSPLYTVWCAIKARCNNNNNQAWYRYGGRGIKICEKWDDPETFIEWAVSAGWKPGLQIDREDNDGDYCPENCRFVTPVVNNHNRSPIKSNNKSGYCGVRFIKHLNKFQSSIGHKLNRSQYLGLYATAEEAVRVRDQFIIDNNLPHKLQLLKR